MLHTTPAPSDIQIAKSICRILTELHHLVELGISRARIDRIRREAIFFLYEGGDEAKWDMSRPHSAAARKARAECGFKEWKALVTYEHAIPLRTLWAGLEASASDPAVMLDFLKRHVCGVIITREENARLNRIHRFSMPSGSAMHDRIARYRAADIQFDEGDLLKLAT